jgi:hypothetical protein
MQQEKQSVFLQSTILQLAQGAEFEAGTSYAGGDTTPKAEFECVLWATWAVLVTGRAASRMRVQLLDRCNIKLTTKTIFRWCHVCVFGVLITVCLHSFCADWRDLYLGYLLPSRCAGVSALT